MAEAAQKVEQSGIDFVFLQNVSPHVELVMALIRTKCDGTADIFSAAKKLSVRLKALRFVVNSATGIARKLFP